MLRVAGPEWGLVVIGFAFYGAAGIYNPYIDLFIPSPDFIALNEVITASFTIIAFVWAVKTIQKTKKRAQLNSLAALVVTLIATLAICFLSWNALLGIGEAFSEIADHRNTQEIFKVTRDLEIDGHSAQQSDTIRKGLYCVKSDNFTPAYYWQEYCLQEHDYRELFSGVQRMIFIVRKSWSGTVIKDYRPPEQIDDLD